jgi:competence protein ComEC
LELGGIRLVAVGIMSLTLVLFLSGLSKKYLLTGLAFCGILIISYSVLVSGVCSVWFLDAGQGDSVLIRCGGRWVLVDTGEQHAAARGVVPALKHLGVMKLSAVVITHPHADHAGGLGEILDNITVERILVNSCFMDSEWAGLLEHRIEVVRGRVELWPGLSVISHDRGFNNPNDNSLIVILDYNGTQVLFTGDIEAQGEKAYSPYLGLTDVLKVAHHGSQTSSSPDFLDLVNPSVAVISCGLGNRFGMPHGAVLEALDQADADVYRTDNNGFIRLVLWPWNKYSIFLFTGR